jgi:DNA-binding LacI/PurR family transcriptional regulator
MLRKKPDIRRSTEAVTLRNVAEYVGLAPCSVSAILNNSAAGMSIPQQTKDRVLRAATRLNYRPNYSARSLRTKRTYTVAVLALDLGGAPAARIIAGAEGFLRANGYS